MSEEIFFKVFFFSSFCITDPMATNTNEQWAKNIWLIQEFSRNVSIKVLSQISAISWL